MDTLVRDISFGVLFTSFETIGTGKRTRSLHLQMKVLSQFKLGLF